MKDEQYYHNRINDLKYHNAVKHIRTLICDHHNRVAKFVPNTETFYYIGKTHISETHTIIDRIKEHEKNCANVSMLYLIEECTSKFPIEELEKWCISEYINDKYCTNKVIGSQGDKQDNATKYYLYLIIWEEKPKNHSV